jgi:hypothetical protein
MALVTTFLTTPLTTVIAVIALDRVAFPVNFPTSPSLDLNLVPCGIQQDRPSPQTPRLPSPRWPFRSLYCSSPPQLKATRTSLRSSRWTGLPSQSISPRLHRSTLTWYHVGYSRVVNIPHGTRLRSSDGDVGKLTGKATLSNAMTAMTVSSLAMATLSLRSSRWTGLPSQSISPRLHRSTLTWS